MSDPTLTHRAHGAHRVVEVSGELDFAVIDAVTEQLEPLLQHAGHGLILDLSQTTFLDSAGIKLLYDIHAALKARGQSLRIVVPPDNLIRRTLELTGTAESFAIHVDLDGATRDTSPDGGS